MHMCTVTIKCLHKLNICKNFIFHYAILCIMAEITELPTLKCERCGWAWVPRTPSPRRCPRCYSQEWNSSNPAPVKEATRGKIRPHNRHERNRQAELKARLDPVESDPPRLVPLNTPDEREAIYEQLKRRRRTMV
jgi:hypothetical protein